MNELVVVQRIRNRIIEVLEWIVGSERAVPELGFDELVNSWEDWTDFSKDESHFPSAVFTRGEVFQITNVSAQIASLCKATPQSIPDTLPTLQSQPWAAVVTSAKAALSELNKRGRFSEEVVKNA
jgi:hypothetical protein